MAKLRLRRGDWADITALELGEIGMVLDRKKLAFSTSGVANRIIHEVTPWEAGILFVVGDLIIQSGQIFQCTIEHVSSVWATESGNWNSVSKSSSVVKLDIAGRDAITGFDLFEGLAAYVVDASADPTVTAGAALYVYDGSAWQKIAEFESLDITINPASETQAGIIEIADAIEMAAGTDDTKAVTPLKLAEQITPIVEDLGDISQSFEYIEEGANSTFSAEDYLSGGEGATFSATTLANAGVGSSPLASAVDSNDSTFTGASDGTDSVVANTVYFKSTLSSARKIGKFRLIVNNGQFQGANELTIYGFTTADNASAEELTVNSIVSGTGSISSGKLTGLASTTAVEFTVVTPSKDYIAYGFKTNGSGTFGATRARVYSWEGFEIINATDLVSMVTNVNLLNTRIGDVSILTNGNPDLVTEVNAVDAKVEALPGPDDITIQAIDPDGANNTNTTPLNEGNYQTDDNTPYTTSATVNLAGWEPYKAFDGNFNNGSGWQATSSGIGQALSINFGVGVVVNKYRFHQYSLSSANRLTSFILQGRIDAGSWQNIDTHSGLADQGSWTPWFTFVNDVPYNEYRIVNQGTRGGNPVIEELQLIPASAGLSIKSDSITEDKLAASLKTPSETAKSVLELATQAEAEAGTDDERAMTALKVSQAIAAQVGGATPAASETVAGSVEIATQGEVDAGVDAVRAVTPATLESRLQNITTNTYANRTDATATITISATDHLVRSSYSSTGAVAVNLPDITTFADGQELIIKDIATAGTNNITVTPNAGDTIDESDEQEGNNVYVLNTDKESVRLVANLVTGNWEVIG
jgi:hypothetical protein